MSRREKALALLLEHTKAENLIKHSLAVEAAMRWYAKYFQQPPEEIELWGTCGLLHDFDYETHPQPAAPDGHPFFGARLLESLQYPPELVRSILAHATYSGVPRDTLMSKTLFAVDELCGLVTASALVRPDRSVGNLESRSVIKKMKDKAFAKGCNREEILLGAAELGLELDQHIENVISALGELELKRQAVST